MRFKSVKHAEYEILKALLVTKVEQTFHESVNEIKMIGIPNGDKVAEQRFNKAASNITKVIFNMLEKRSKYIPEEHIEYGLDIKKIKKIVKGEV